MNQPPHSKPKLRKKDNFSPDLVTNGDRFHPIKLGNTVSKDNGVDQSRPSVQSSPVDVPESVRSADIEPKAAANRHSQASLNVKPQISPRIIAIAIALSTLPPLALATATFFSHKSIEEKISQNPVDSSIVRNQIERERTYLLWMTWLTAMVAGGLSFLALRKVFMPVIQASGISAMLVRRLRIQQMSSTSPANGKDAIANLSKNMQNLEQRFPDLLLKQELSAEMLQVLTEISTGLRNSGSEQEVLNTTTNRVRQAFRTDRVTVFRYSNYPQGTFVAESTASGLPKLAWSSIANYPVNDRYLSANFQPQAIGIDDTDRADLSDEEIELYQRFGVKAIVTAPIYRDGQLFGLLIAHQCRTERFWQALELDLFAQIASQVGGALESAQRIEQAGQKINRAEVLIRTTKAIRSSLDENEILKTSVEAVRSEIGSERVLIYGFDEQWYGTVIAESIASGYPRMLWAEIHDPCFAEGYIDKYQDGRVQATNNIQEAGLTECHIDQLTAFAVKANLVAPILKDGYLFSLLIAHQCSAPREWQQWEIDWFAQIASQIGYALDHARLLQKIEAESQRSHLFGQLTRRIRASLKFEEIVKTSVEETRRAIGSDRVIILALQPDGSGEVAAEAVIPGLPHAAAHKFKPSWIPEPLRHAYKQGQVIATDDVFAAQFNAEQIQVLQRLKIQSSLAAPILVKNEQLFGLLIADQCAHTRQWQAEEIEMFAQIATQIGYALEPAQIVERVEQAYQSAAIVTLEQRRQLDQIEEQLTHLLEQGQALSAKAQEEEQSQMDSVKDAYDRIQSLAEITQKIASAAEQTKIREQHISEILQAQFQTIDFLQTKNSALQNTDTQAVQTIQEIQLPVERLSETIELVTKVSNQLKLQSVNVALEASRYGTEGQKLRVIAEKIMSYLRQLEVDLAEVKPLIANIQDRSQTAAMSLHGSFEASVSGGQLLASAQQELDRILAVTGEIGLLADGIAQSANEQNTNLQNASQSTIQVAKIVTNKTDYSKLAGQLVEELAALAAIFRSLRS
jgi:methyl-accepting chemotaxis protein PixJ